LTRRAPPIRSPHWWVLLVGILACGGAGTTAPTQKEQSVDGRIVVSNQTAVVLGVAYLREDEADGPRIVRTQVQPGTDADVSGGTTLLPADTLIELDLVLEAADEAGVRVRRKVTVAIDGETLVSISLADPGDPFSAEIEVAAIQAR
jgi:hypothetical protein